MKRRTKMVYAWDNWIECHPRTAWLVVEFSGRVVAYPESHEPQIVGYAPPLWSEGRIGTATFMDIGGMDWMKLKVYVGDQNLDINDYENAIRAEGCDMVASKLRANGSQGAELSAKVAEFIAKQLRPQ